MKMHRFRPRWWAMTLAAAAAIFGTGFLLTHDLYSSSPENPPAPETTSADESGGVLAQAPRVETAKPKQGGIPRKITLPGSAHSFESAELFAKVSGFLKSLEVDIGSRVTRGQLLAVIDVPELSKDVEFSKAELRQAQAEVTQMQARVQNAIAEHKAAEAGVAQAQAELQRRQAEASYSEKQYQRVRELHELNSIEERIVDEKQFQFQAAQANIQAAESAILTARQQTEAAAARVDLAKADLLVSQAKVEVSQSNLARAEVMLSYTHITSPYDGVVTGRHFHRGAFIRAANQGGEVALLSVDRTDLMRIVIQVPDREAPFIQPGDKTTIRFDALPQQTFNQPIARIAEAQDPQTRAMRVEVDLPNAGQLRDHMYARVEIELDPGVAGVRVPSGSLVGDTRDGKAQLFVVDQGTARLTPVEVGADNGIEVEVLSGLTTEDEIVQRPPGGLADGTKVVSAATSSPTATQ